MNIGLIAHDSKKKLMQNFCIAYRGILCKNELYATGTTGRLVEEDYQFERPQISCQDIWEENTRWEPRLRIIRLNLMIFLRNPMGAKPHEPDTKNIFRLCDMHNIPLATNLATAELLIKSLDRGDLEWREMYK